MNCGITAPARLPSFHTCVGTNAERLTPKWYKEHGNYLMISFSLTLFILMRIGGECFFLKIFVLNMFRASSLQMCLLSYVIFPPFNLYLDESFVSLEKLHLCQKG